MKDKLNEQISALVDDELDASEQALLLRQLSRDESLRGQFARYQLISDALKDGLPDRVDPEFHLRVQAALQDEAPHHAPAVTRQLMRLYKPVTGLAIAASIAVVAVLSLQSVRQTSPDATPVVASAPAPADYIRADGQSPVARSASSTHDLDAYLVNHNEFAAKRGMRGSLPYMHIVGHGDDQPGSQEDAE